MCCISLYMHIFQKPLKLKIFVIKMPKDLLFILMVLTAVFITVCRVKAVQDDISEKTIPISLHHTVLILFPKFWFEYSEKIELPPQIWCLFKTYLCILLFPPQRWKLWEAKTTAYPIFIFIRSFFLV